MEPDNLGLMPKTYTVEERCPHPNKTHPTQKTKSKQKFHAFIYTQTICFYYIYKMCMYFTYLCTMCMRGPQEARKGYWIPLN